MTNISGIGFDSIHSHVSMLVKCLNVRHILFGSQLSNVSLMLLTDSLKRLTKHMQSFDKKFSVLKMIMLPWAIDKPEAKSQSKVQAPKRERGIWPLG